MSKVVKNNPEEFYYYVPTHVNYTTEYTNYILNEDGMIVGAEQPFDADFFLKYPDGSRMAYWAVAAPKALFAKSTSVIPFDLMYSIAL